MLFVHTQALELLGAPCLECQPLPPYLSTTYKGGIDGDLPTRGSSGRFKPYMGPFRARETIQAKRGAEVD